MLLKELGNRQTRVKIIRNDGKVFDAEAMIGSRKIEFSAVYYDGRWDVVFSEARFDDDAQEWLGSDVDLTGSGNEFEVLSMVMTCMKELLKKNPQAIAFTANKRGDEKKRVDVYRRLASKLLSDFDLEEVDIGNEVEFRFTKPLGSTKA